MNSNLHAGPIMEKIGDIPRNCETTERNADCYYLFLGCLGCTIKIPTLPKSWADAMRPGPPMPLAELQATIERLRRRATLRPSITLGHEDQGAPAFGQDIKTIGPGVQ